MRSLIRKFGPFLLAAAVVSPVLTVGCATPARYYDASHSDYHVWDSNEAANYNRWEQEGHRDHQDFNKRSDGDQKDYWTWRHNQNGH
jgi:hypothetical protein